jgi:dTDP-4-dehydrorhamnose 3,5-epimerase
VEDAVIAQPHGVAQLIDPNQQPLRLVDGFKVGIAGINQEMNATRMPSLAALPWPVMPELLAHEIELPDGVHLNSLTVHPDFRGSLVELFRESFPGAFRAVQWNLTRSAAGVLRGVHVHRVHRDYLIAVTGCIEVGLRDLRAGSPTEGATALLELRGDAPAALSIPPGVAHGFHFPEPSVHLYGVSHVWDADDELGCRWSDPDLEIGWPFDDATISPRDAALPPLRELLDVLRRQT